MKFTLTALIFLAIATNARAQGGIGNMPREDLFMLSAVTRDSLDGELLARIDQLRGYAAANKVDSAAMLIAYNGAPDKTGKWARAINLTNSDEKTRVETLLAKLNKLYAGSPEIHREYFAAFKDKDNPAGMMLLYQIKYGAARAAHMVSYRFYPIGDALMLGEIQ
jgi:hypothetical protein